MSTISAEFNGNEFEIELTAETDTVVVSCDLLSLQTPLGDLILVIDAETRKTPVGQAVQALWDAVKEAQEA